MGRGAGLTKLSVLFIFNLLEGRKRGEKMKPHQEQFCFKVTFLCIPRVPSDLYFRPTKQRDKPAWSPPGSQELSLEAWGGDGGSHINTSKLI